MRTPAFVLFLLISLSASANETDSCAVTYSLRDSIVNYAQHYIGTSYKYGGSSPNTGFDCSGFVAYIFKRFGIQLPHSSKSLADVGSEKTADDAEAGDIIVFQGRANTSIGHVGIVYNTPWNELIFIHASSSRSGGVIFSSLHESYYKQRFVKIVDVLT